MHRPPRIPGSDALVVALAGTLLLAAAMGIGRFAYTPLLPPLQDALGWSVAQAGDVASANYLGYLLGALAAALLVRRTDRGLWLALGMFASAASTGAGALFESYPAWLALRFVSGVASALCLVIGTAIVGGHLLRCERPDLIWLHFGGVGLGIVGSVVVIETLRRGGGSVYGQWGALGVAALVLLAVAGWRFAGLVRRAPVPVAVPPASTANAPRRVPAGVLTRLIIAYGLFGFGYVVTATFIVAIARRLPASTSLEPLTWVVVGVLAAPSVLAWQGLARRFGVLAALRYAYVVEAAGVLVAGCVPGPVAVVAGGALLGGTFMGITALGLSTGRSWAGAQQDGVIGWMTASFGLGQFLGPAIAGRLAQLSEGFTVPSLLAAALLLVGCALLRDRAP
ncbi:MAG: YbfB/YjiJ family MFS transporter [Gammaproteobacteria bacterium]|nr:YbfB/YjiJ family MFS transporter [Gammaproteobacteria bacterium]